MRRSMKNKYESFFILNFVFQELDPNNWFTKETRTGGESENIDNICDSDNGAVVDLR